MGLEAQTTARLFLLSFVGSKEKEKQRDDAEAGTDINGERATAENRPQLSVSLRDLVLYFTTP